MSDESSYKRQVHRLWPSDADATLSDLLAVNRRNAERWRKEERPAPPRISGWVSKANAALDEIAPNDDEAGALMGRMIQILWRCDPALAAQAPRLLQTVLDNALHHGPDAADEKG